MGRQTSAILDEKAKAKAMAAKLKDAKAAAKASAVELKNAEKALKAHDAESNRMRKPLVKAVDVATSAHIKAQMKVDSIVPEA